MAPRFEGEAGGAPTSPAGTGVSKAPVLTLGKLEADVDEAASEVEDCEETVVLDDVVELVDVEVVRGATPIVVIADGFPMYKTSDHKLNWEQPMLSRRTYLQRTTRLSSSHN